MADTYTLPVFTAADINGIVTAGQDGTYNITYTNLKSEQIDAIGAAFEAAMQTNLKPIALSGNYSDLENKPSASNLQGFHKAAFSGKTSDLNNDEGFLTEETDPIFAASTAANITNQDIINWNNKSDFDETTLAAIATSGNYNDLNNTFTSINISNFIYKKENTEYNILTGSDYDTIQNCGLQSGYCRDINMLYNSDTDTDNNQNLLDSLRNLLFEFDNGKICYFQDKYSNYHLITNIIPYYDNNHTLQNITISCTLSVDNNFNSFNNNETADTILSNLQYIFTVMSIIIDINSNILFSIRKRISPPLVEGYGLGVNYTNGALAVRISDKVNNKLEIIDTSGEEGLYSN